MTIDRRPLTTPLSRILPPLLLIALAAAGCSRTDDHAGAPKVIEAAGPAGGGRALRPGLWKTIARAPTGEQTSTQCVGENYDPALAAAKAAPCGEPQITPIIDGFTLELTCRKGRLGYSLAGIIKGDFQTRTSSELEMTVQGFGASKRMRLSSQSVYVGPCDAPQAPPTP